MIQYPKDDHMILIIMELMELLRGIHLTVRYPQKTGFILGRINLKIKYYFSKKS